MEDKSGPAIGAEQRYVDVRGAEKYTSLSRWTLARSRERGELPAIRVGAAVRFSVDDLDDFMKARRTTRPCSPKQRRREMQTEERSAEETK